MLAAHGAPEPNDNLLGRTASLTDEIPAMPPFETERPSLVPYAGRFDGFHAVPASASKT